MARVIGGLVSRNFLLVVDYVTEKCKISTGENGGGGDEVVMRDWWKKSSVDHLRHEVQLIGRVVTELMSSSDEDEENDTVEYTEALLRLLLTSIIPKPWLMRPMPYFGTYPFGFTVTISFFHDCI